MDLCATSPVHSAISAAPSFLRGDSFLLDKPCRVGNGQRGNRASPVSASAMVTTDHFGTLGVTQQASLGEIKNAYRQLAKRYHPDVCRGDQCHIKFVQINNAYEHAINCLNGKMQYAYEMYEEDYGAGDELEEWENWMGWEGAGTLDFSVDLNGDETQCTCQIQ